MIEKGVPAVVAMQYPVLIDSATLFAEKFYASLHQRDSLADAVGNARKFMEVNGSEDQWYRPVLYMRWADNHGGQLFEKPEPVVEKKPVVEIDWHGICSDRLTSQIDQMKTPLTTGGHSPLPNSPGDPYIELNLVQRDPNKPFPRPQVQSVSPSEGVQHNLANEVSREYTHKEFFDEVLSNPDSLKKNGRPQLAIVGEPGSGKTTLLLRIAQWLLEKEKGFPIWISLKEIPVYFPEWSQKPGGLNHYLFKIWLKAAVNKNKEEWNNTKGKYQQALNELLASGKAWLFLDGANEIYGNDVIVKINNELGETTWTQVPVVLNCRLNEWEFSTNHFISNSWVYRILPYNDTQVCDYIGKRFNDKVEKKDMLVRQINNHQRLKNLAKNPLCLSMLCFILGEEENFALSSTITKADLYQEFKKKYNKLKVSSSQATSEERSDIRKIIPPQPNVQPSDPPITPSERNDLLGSIHQKLGELSLRAMQEHSPFVLKENVLNDVFCDTQSKALLKLLEHWGWLTKVNLGTVDDCFTFFHPSFQEYFAATAIPQQQDCGHFFLHHIPQNPKSPEASYRIFDSKWKEVILLWLGRKDVSLDDKRNFINELVNFNDGWENFYRYRAYFLAAEGIAEFQDCPQKQKTDIVRAVVEWSLDIFNDENKKQPGETFILPIRQTAMDVLERTDHKLVMERLNIINLDKGNDEEVKTISDFFERYPHKNTIPSPIVFEDDNARCRKIQGIIAAAQQLIQNCANYQNHPVFWQAIERLGEIGKGDHDAIEFLKDVFDQSQGNTYLHLKSALHLAAIGISEATQIGNRKIPDFFVTMINENPTSIQQKLQGYLGRIGIVDPVLSVLSRLLAFYITLTGRCDIQELIEVTSKIKTIGEYQSEGTYQTTFEELQKILPDKDYLTIIASLRQYLSSEREQEIEIPSYTPTELQTLQNLGIADYLYKTGEPSERFCDCYKTLWYCAQVMPYPEFYSAFNPESK